MLKKIADNVKEILNIRDIVSPKEYQKIYSTEAYKLGVEPSTIDGVSDCEDTLQGQCYRLENSANKAITAIDDKDTESLEEVKSEVFALREEIKELKELVYKDALTGAYNRKYLELILDEQENFKEDGYMTIIDLNDLKYTNDNIGHVVGDKVIVLLVSKLKEIEETVIRYGGDEFLIISDDGKAIDRALYEMRETLWLKTFKYHEHSFKVNFSFATIKYSNTYNFDLVLSDVDKMMYKDKVANKKPFYHKILK